MKAILMVNSECNIKCTHCYLPYKGNRSPEYTLKTVNDLQSNGYEVGIAGSETLLQPEYLKSYEQSGQDHLLTNGIILYNDKSLYELLEHHGIKKLVFSIHFGIQNQLRSVPENLVAKIVRESKERGFNTQITTTITSKNYSEIEEMCDKAINYGADIIQFDRLVQIGRGNNMNSDTLKPEQVDEFFRRVLDARKNYGKEIIEIRPHGNFGPRPGSRGEMLSAQNIYCPAGREIVAVDPQDNVYGCPFAMHPNSIIGKLENGRIRIDKDILSGRRDTCITHLL